MEVYSNLLIIAVILSLSYFIYSQGPRPDPSGHLVYHNTVHEFFGSPSLALLRINSSGPDKVVELDVDQASSREGILSLQGSSYIAIQSLCTAHGTTFFSVYTPLPGDLIVNASGQSWIDDHLAKSIPVEAGWHELIISHASTCTIVLPGGQALSSVTSNVSSIPVIGRFTSSAFRLYLPFEGARHQINIIFSGGIDVIEL